MFKHTEGSNMKLTDGYSYQIFSWCVLLSFHHVLKVCRSATYYFRRPSYFYADDTDALLTVCKCSVGKISMRFLHLCCNSTLKAILQFDPNMVLTQDITVADKNKTCLKFIRLLLYSVILNCSVFQNKPSELLQNISFVQIPKCQNVCL